MCTVFFPYLIDNAHSAFFIDARCVHGDAAGSGVLLSGILPVVLLIWLGQNSNQGDEDHWQRETCMVPVQEEEGVVHTVCTTGRRAKCTAAHMYMHPAIHVIQKQVMELYLSV